MLVEEFEPSGRRKVLERRMILRCKLCCEQLDAPDDVEQWGWLKGDNARGFLREHAAHGDASTVGWHFEFIEKD